MDFFLFSIDKILSTSDFITYVICLTFCCEPGFLLLFSRARITAEAFLITEYARNPRSLHSFVELETARYYRIAHGLLLVCVKKNTDHRNPTNKVKRRKTIRKEKRKYDLCQYH